MFTTTVIHMYFVSLALVCKFLLIFLRISLETKMSPLISQMLAFLGTLFILTIKIFLSFASDFSCQHYNVGKL